MEIFDKDLLDKDDLIGRVDIPLLPLYKKGVRDGWVPIKYERALVVLCFHKYLALVTCF